MQEDIESRTVNLAISTTKLTARTVISAAQMYLKHRKEVKTQKAQEKPTGKQTVKELIGQGDGVTNIDISKTDLKGFESVARKYGIDYAIRKDASVHPPKYLVFFKAKDTDAMTAAFNEYSARVMQRSQRPSVLRALRDIAVRVAELPARVINRNRQRTQGR